jgi:hypothetical protein
MIAKQSANLTKNPTIKYSCGIDVGEKNMAISFVDKVPESLNVVCYKGSPELMCRYEIATGEEPEMISADRSNDKYLAFASLLDKIREFNYTETLIIEMQLSQNKSNMTRLEGILFGYIVGRYPNIRVCLSGSTIRNKFLRDKLNGYNVEEIDIPRVAQTKKASLQYVYLYYADIWEYLIGKDKIDDICDSVVYADIAYEKLQTK